MPDSIFQELSDEKTLNFNRYTTVLVYYEQCKNHWLWSLVYFIYTLYINEKQFGSTRFTLSKRIK